ncbi:TOTE conflict system archaeo-eukaryotic primase domain-containing protein [Rhizobium ruizarguesonis]|uniref:TOTE conflict system archaeo-eukaryotic primase domain-containing protein n=1 Tax=Rhizobium ruizarguesonis TaxID=2081791 RepID=UPI0010311CF6|nr:hypothetical protein [Rhizobium ruizarguesonis]TAV05575.1 hypothetical protein ELI39_10015 [Rhizobium ruizarguesonis]
MSAHSPTAFEASSAHRLCELFLGAETRHGTYDPARLRLVGSKMEMKDATGEGPRDVKEPPTPQLWEQHLAGARPLGVSPLREDGMSRVGVVDIDRYDGGFDHGELAGKIRREGLPLVLTRSKSGGGHVWLFASDWMPQATMNAALVALAGRLGHADAETYPPDTGLGNWMNMPYLGGDRSDRYGVKPGGLGMSVAEFLEAAEKARMSPDQIEALAASQAAGVGTATSRRVLRKLTERAAEIAAMIDGRKRTLHDTAFLFGKYVLKGRIDKDTVIGRLVAAGVKAGLEHRIAESQVRNGLEARLGKRGGDGDDDDDDDDGRYAEIERIVIITGHDEPLWRVTVADYGDITLPSREVWKNELFNLRCAERLRVAFKRLSVNEWADRLNGALKLAEFEAAPKDETPEYVFRMALQDFCFDRHRAESMEEIVLGKPYRDEDNDRIWFRFGDLYRQLCEQPGSPFRGWSRNRLGGMMKAIGRDGVDVFTTTTKLKKKTTEVRWVRMSLFDGPTELPLPRPPAPQPI